MRTELSEPSSPGNRSDEYGAEPGWMQCVKFLGNKFDRIVKLASVKMSRQTNADLYSPKLAKKKGVTHVSEESG